MEQRGAFICICHAMIVGVRGEKKNAWLLLSEAIWPVPEFY